MLFLCKCSSFANQVGRVFETPTFAPKLATNKYVTKRLYFQSTKF